MKTKMEIRELAIMKIDCYMITMLKNVDIKDFGYHCYLENKFNSYIEVLLDCEVITDEEREFLKKCVEVIHDLFIRKG